MLVLVAPFCPAVGFALLPAVLLLLLLLLLEFPLRSMLLSTLVRVDDVMLLVACGVLRLAPLGLATGLGTGRAGGLPISSALDGIGVRILPFSSQSYYQQDKLDERQFISKDSQYLIKFSAFILYKIKLVTRFK